MPRKASARFARCVGPLGLPIEGVRYLVTDRSGEPIQRGLTDVRGRFPLLGKRGRAVELFDGEGSRLGRHALPKRGVRLRIPQERWLAARSAGPRQRPEQLTIAAYAAAAQGLEARAQAKGLSVKLAAGRLRGAGREIATLVEALEGALRDARGLARLRDLLVARGAKPPSRGEAATNLGKERRAHSRPSFVPGCGLVWERIQRLAVSNPDEARAALGLLFSLNRSASRTLGALGWSRGDAAGWGGGRGGGLGPDDGIPPELIDPYDEFGGGRRGGEPDLDPGIPDFRSPAGRQAARCEVTLLDAVDALGRPTPSPRSGGGGPVVTGRILSVTPDHEVQSGSRRVEIEFETPLERLEGLLGGVPVSFPGRDGRIETTGQVVSSALVREGVHKHVVAVTTPFRTREGIVQVLGLPRECWAHPAPVSDPALRELLGHVADCLGTGGASGSPGGADVECEAEAINWTGGVPEVHFRWQDASGAFVDGDRVDCVGHHRAEVPAEAMPAPARAGRADGLLVRRDGAEIAMAWTPTSVDEGPCHATRRSVVLELEADAPLVVQLRAANEPEGQVSLRLSAPSEGPLGEHLIERTVYHVPWTDESRFPRSSWTDLGRATVGDQFVEIRLPARDLPKVAHASVQVLAASASNALPGSGRRGLEVLRYLRPARVTAIAFESLEEQRDMSQNPRIGPEERLLIRATIEPPTYADTGVDLTVTFRMAGQVVDTVTVFTRSRQPVQAWTVQRMWENSLEGRVPVDVSVSHRYRPAEFPEGAALGPQPGEGASSSLIALPRIVVMGFMGQWDPIFGGGGAVSNTWLVALLRNVESDLGASLVSRMVVTGRVGQNPGLATGAAPVDAWLSGQPGYFEASTLFNTVKDAGGQLGSFQQVDDSTIGNRPGGCVLMFASEWGFREGNNEWGLPSRTSPEAEWQVDRYIEQSDIRTALGMAGVGGARRTHFVFVGHSRGAGACFDVMSWLKRGVPSGSWDVLAAVFLDAMYTDGYFQPVTRFPVCAEAMLHFHASERGTISNHNCQWDGTSYWTGTSCRGEAPSCGGDTFLQFRVIGTHGTVPFDSTEGGTPVIDIVRSWIVRKIRERTDVV